MQEIRSKNVSGGCQDEFMTGGNQDNTSTVRDAVVDARRENSGRIGSAG